MPMTSREMIKLLKKNGFKKVSQNGSHVKMKNEENLQSFVFKIHNFRAPFGHRACGLHFSFSVYADLDIFIYSNIVDI